jgi:p-hydroxybenzoate 3-monooxygenase
VLAQVRPSTKELIYARHERGFALHSMRSPSLSRFYLQVAPDEDLTAWSDERIWQELRVRLETVPGWRLETGPILERGLAAMRSEVMEPMRHGRLLLAGDVAHIVPATGAKGLNLAVADVVALSEALAAWYERGSTELIDAYSSACLRRVWRVQHFSNWMTRLLHTFASDDAFERRLQLAQLEQLVQSRAAATLLAENYVAWRAADAGRTGAAYGASDRRVRLAPRIGRKRQGGRAMRRLCDVFSINLTLRWRLSTSLFPPARKLPRGCWHKPSRNRAEAQNGSS